MVTAATSAVSLWHRVEQVLREHLGRKVVSAEDARLMTMAQSPRAAIGLSESQRRQLAKLENPTVAAR
jgi:ribosomal protein S18 acetylase RimI-like enzyme